MLESSMRAGRRRPILAALGLLAAASLPAAQLTLSPDEITTGSNSEFTFTVEGCEDKFLILIVGPTQEETVVDGLGTFGVGLENATYLHLGFIPEDGMLLTCDVPCLSPLLGNTFYVQGFAFGPEEVCGISNVSTLNITDENSPDCDDDGLPDVCEPDCDADGIPDDCEDDCDNDGIPDDCEDDCDADGIPDDCEDDCDADGIPDDCEDDCDNDGIPDDCENDCDNDGTPDDCEDVPDCNNNYIPDNCDIASGESKDLNNNGIPDECEPDCDDDGIPDDIEDDCDSDGIPDDCEPDCDYDGIPDDCEPDCDADGIPDECEPDCDADGIPDDCEADCDADGTPDDCEDDCDNDGTPDDCEDDCDADGIPDDCEDDCDYDGIPDDCEPDCDADGIPDDCEDDCDADGTPDDCEDDCDADGIPDDCEDDCDADGTPDDCEEDCDADGIPDDCEPDGDNDGIPDDCEECPPPSHDCELGCWNLKDSPHGNAASPYYGLRLDGLFGDYPNVYTFSWEHPGAGGVICYDGDGTLTISGVAYGGLDVGSDWDDDVQGYLTVDFVYTNVECKGDGLVVKKSNGGNGYGTVTWEETGETIPLFAKHNDSNIYATFDDGDFEGWMKFENGSPGCCQDWISEYTPASQCPEIPDCDSDGTPDWDEPDCDYDGIPDDCEPDCDNDGIPDDCDEPTDGPCAVVDPVSVPDHPYDGDYGALILDSYCTDNHGPEFEWGHGTTFEEFGDGTARLLGTLESRTHPGSSLHLDISFWNRVDPGDWNHPPEDPYLNLYSDLPNQYLAPNGPVDPDTWHYYREAYGLVSGSGDFNGVWLAWEIDGPEYDDPPAQVGTGAHGRNVNFGLGAWMYQYVDKQPYDDDICFKEDGNAPWDYYVEIFPEPECEPECVQNMTVNLGSGSKVDASLSLGESMLQLVPGSGSIEALGESVGWTGTLRDMDGSGNAYRLNLMFTAPVIVDEATTAYGEVAGVLVGVAGSEVGTTRVLRSVQALAGAVLSDGRILLPTLAGGNFSIREVSRGQVLAETTGYLNFTPE